MRNFLLSTAAFFFLLPTGLSQIRLPAILADSMVLQQSTNVPLWGWASPGEKISVSGSWSGKTVTTITAKNGRWILPVKTLAAGGPYDISIKGKQSIVLHGVLMGEVWLCSGQSNMEMPLQGWENTPIANSAEEIASADYPRMRLFTVTKKVAYDPQEDVKGKWESCEPFSVAGFSATAYFFGRELSKRLGVPVGLIHSSWGGTVAEAWTSNSGLSPLGDFEQEIRHIDSLKQYADQWMQTDKKNEASWKEALNKKNGQFFLADYDAANWKKMTIPNNWENAGYPELDGLVWFRKEIILPDSWAGKALKLDLGPIDDYDITWFNGKEVGEVQKDGFWATNRNYSIPAGFAKAGKNSIAIRVTDNAGSGGIYGNKELLKIYPEGGNPAEGIGLAGDWSFYIEAVKPKPSVDLGPNQPSVLFNGMIAPIVPFAIAGVIWYQGEANVSRAAQYERLFPATIKDWRTKWGRGNFPFYFVQIAPYPYGGDHTDAAALRDAQRKTLERVSNTGMVITLDIGDTSNIHPANKQEVGLRLSRWALYQTYGKKDVVYSGPLFSSMTVKGSKAIVSFTHTEGGLAARGRGLQSFELAGSDGKWMTATAVIQGNTVVVTSPGIEHPVMVRYGWSDNAQASLFNGAGLPASSFSFPNNRK